MFLALEITDRPGTVNYVHPKISKPTRDACNLRIFSHAARDFGGRGGGEDFWWGNVSGRQSLPPCSLRNGSDSLPATHLPGCWAGLRAHPASYHQRTAWHGRERKKLTAEAAKLTWKRRADTEGKEDPEAAWEGPALCKDGSQQAFLESVHRNTTPGSLTYSQAASAQTNSELRGWKHGPLKPFVVTGQLQCRCHYSQCLGLLKLPFIS